MLPGKVIRHDDSILFRFICESNRSSHSRPPHYARLLGGGFVPWLSITDIHMLNNREKL